MTADSLDAIVRDKDAGDLMLAGRERTMTFGDFRDEAARVAGSLRALGFGRGDVLAVWLPTVPEWLVLCFAAARIGAAVAALNTRYRAKEARDVLGATRARGVALPAGFLDVDYAGMLGEGSSLCVISVPMGGADPVRGSIPYAELAGGNPAPDEGRPDDIAAIFTTSGTTGVPKLPSHRQGSIARHARNAARAFGIGDGDVAMCALPLAGVFGFSWALAAAAAGAACVLEPAFDAAEIAESMRRNGVTHFTGADNMLRAVLDRPGPYGRWRAGGFANFTGQPLELVRVAEERAGVRLVGLYGASEIFALMSRQPEDAGAERRALAGGVPVDASIEVRAVDPETGRILAHGEPGELQVRGYNVMAGYLHNPEATAQALTPDGWYRTGDLGYTEDAGGFGGGAADPLQANVPSAQRRTPRADCSFVFLSRMKDSLRLRGFLVDPLEIEEFLEGHDAVRYAQVVGVPGPHGDVAVAFVQPGPGASVTEEELVAYCSGELANYKVPSRIVLVEGFPTVAGPNGEKVQKTKLRDMGAALIGSSATSSPPSG